MQSWWNPHVSLISLLTHLNQLVERDLINILLLSTEGVKYFVTFLDDYTKRSDLYFLKFKKKIFLAFKSCKMQTKKGSNIILRRKQILRRIKKITIFRIFDLIILFSEGLLCLVFPKNRVPNVQDKLSCARLALYFKKLIWIIKNEIRWFIQLITFKIALLLC